jgi:hypothetical protein
MNIKLLLVPINFKLGSSTQLKYPAKHKAMTSNWIKLNCGCKDKRNGQFETYTKNAVMWKWIRIQNNVLG